MNSMELEHKLNHLERENAVLRSALNAAIQHVSCDLCARSCESIGAILPDGWELDRGLVLCPRCAGGAYRFVELFPLRLQLA